MKRIGTGDYFERLEQRETARLDSNVRALWDQACRSKVAPKLPFKHQNSKITYKSFARQAQATRTMTLTVLNKVIETARCSIYRHVAFRGLINQQVLHVLFRDHWSDLSGLRKWNICRILWRVAWEFFRLEASWLLVGGRRFRAMGKGKNKRVDPSLPARLLEHALKLICGVQHQGGMNLQGAIRLRTAAHMAIVSEVASRLSETALMDTPQLEWNGADLFIITDPQHSKTRKGGRDPVSGSVAIAVKAYLAQGRRFLVARGNDAATDALWVTADGVKAEAGTMACALRRETKRLFSNGVASGDVRRAAVSQPGLDFDEQWHNLRHAFGSTTAFAVYSNRDRAQAVKQNAELSTIQKGDIPAFSPPLPRRPYWLGRR